MWEVVRSWKSIIYLAEQLEVFALFNHLSFITGINSQQTRIRAQYGMIAVQDIEKDIKGFNNNTKMFLIFFPIIIQVTVNKQGSCAQYGMIAVQDIEKDEVLFEIARPVLLHPQTSAIANIVQNGKIVIIFTFLHIIYQYLLFYFQIL